MPRPGTSYDDGRVETLRDEKPGFPASAYRRPDGRILEDVAAALEESPLDASQIEVAVADGEVTLEGTVPTRAEVEQAEQIAHAVRGVHAVHNMLVPVRADDAR